ncbi:hypothetical protein [Streptomyces sp. WM6378]|uniref:hypothetical protein n=1 Tax=Streptomyces sp. WM6378 TaxID=1415557 RepID=UPI000B248AD6|nr:hypothetical protein [Streptomyces sp. WM6378]
MPPLPPPGMKIDRTVLNAATVPGYVIEGLYKGHGFGGAFSTSLFGGAAWVAP